MNKNTLNFDGAIRTIVREEMELAKLDILASIEAKPTAPDTPRTYTRKQVCECLKCTFPTFHRLVNEGAFKVIKRGHATLVLADDFDELLRQGKVGKYIRVRA